MATHRVQQWLTFSRMWWVFDAKWQSPFRAAPVIQFYLTGKWKPIYHPLSDCGDHVVIINTKHIAMRDQYWRTFKYFHHTGYPGGFSATRAYKVHDKDPTKIMEKAVYSRLPGNLHRRPIMARLHLYPEEDVPEEILKNINGQIRQVMPVPKRLDEYSQEQREAFPRMFQWPADYVPRPSNKKIPEDDT